MSRPTSLHIDLDAIRHNFSIVRQAAPGTKVVACVKANAYGHGMAEVTRTLSKADLFGVASIDEARTLKESIIDVPVLLLEGVFQADELIEVQRQGFQTVIHSTEQVEQIAEANLAEPIPVWLKIDTGMHRLGIDPESAKAAYERLRSSPNVGSITLMTHFACAEELDNPFTQQQIDSFDRVESELDIDGSSLSNSAAILAWPQAHQQWVRPGFMLYGNSPFDCANELADQLRPAMTFTTEIISVRSIKRGEGVGYNHQWRAERDSTIAVAAVGYGDGYPRNTNNRCPVLVNGEMASTVGHVAMDLLNIDVTDLGTASVGDPVELWGANLSVNRVAQHSGYSPYELLTRLPPRIKRSFT